MDIKFTCPNPKCEQHLVIDEASAGAVVPCPFCNENLTVPQPAAAESPPDELAPAPPGPSGLAAAAPAASAPPPPTPVPPPRPPSPPAPPPRPPQAAGPTAQARPEVSFDLMVRGLVGALNLRKLGFFLLSAFASLVLCGLVFLAAMRSRHSDLGGFLLLLDVVMVMGFSGVVAGGVARMAYTESQGQPVGIAGAFAFCGRRFIPLFLGVVILMTLLLISFAMANGMILVVNKLTSAGAFLGAVLFIPQAVFNGLLVLVLVAAVLVPIAVAVEQAGALQAIRRLDRCARRYPGELLFQCEITFFGLSLPCLMLVLLLLAVGTAVLTNGPSGFSLPLPSLVSGGSGNEEEGVFASPRNPTREESHPPKSAKLFAWTAGLSGHEQSGDSIRWASLLLLVLMLLAYPLVYWICTFTFFYEAMLPFLRGVPRETVPT